MTHAQSERRKKQIGKPNCTNAQVRRAKDKKAFGKKIRMLRHKLGGTQPNAKGKQDRARGFSREQLANDLGVSAVTIGRWERGETASHQVFVMQHLDELIKKHLK